ncbi:hypothetical protein [Streptomyces atroolivaceus]|uniref:Uncharacterized protein n=1 Tax=Streptomyces atroolivaceus TaxID=66869 RepID=A0ABV9VGN3_STRAZ|nr:hypothetical protein [Streptomyces atroolivaceus]
MYAQGRRAQRSAQTAGRPGPARGPRPGTLPPGPEALLSLQRAAGNAAVVKTHGPVVQRVAVTDPRSKQSVETDGLSPEQRVALATQLLRAKKTKELDRLRAAHPDERDSLSERALRTIMPRYRDVHAESEGDSESEDPNVFYRTLRPEELPLRNGLRPPIGNDVTKSAADHIRAGSRAKVKSSWVSFTRSLKTAAAWAAENESRIAKVRLPDGARVTEGRVYDTTDPEQLAAVFGNSGGSAENFAKASQEVVVKGGLDAEAVLRVFKAKYISPEQYEQHKAGSATDSDLYAVVRTRAKVTESKQKTTPKPIGIYSHQETELAAPKRKNREGTPENDERGARARVAS